MFQKNKSIKSKYKLESVISEDLVSHCYQGTSHNGNVLAWKVKREFLNTDSVKNCISSAERLMEIRHPNILPVLDYFYDGKDFFLVQELTDDFVTFDVFLRDKKHWNSKLLWKIVVQILAGLIEIESKGLVYGALNLNNIYVNSKFQVRLTNIQLPIDLLKPIITQVDVYEECIFYAPEFIQRGDYFVSSDIYSFGMLLYYLFAKKWPYKNSSSLSVLKESLTKNPRPLNLAEGRVPKKLEVMIMTCIAKDPEKRFNSFEGLIRNYKKNIVNTTSADLEFGVDGHGEGTVMIEKEIEDSLNIRRLKGQNSVLKMLLVLVVSALFFGSLYVGYQLYAVAIPVKNVPSIRGLAVDDALAVLKSHQLDGEVISQRTSAWYPKGFVLEQAPRYGRKVKENRVIKLYVSDGVKKVLVPDIIGKKLSEVESVISLQDTEIKIVGQQFSQSFPEGAVIEQYPTPNNFINHNESVSIVVSQGYPVGMKVEAVASSLFFNYEGFGQCSISFSLLSDWKPQDVSIYFIDADKKKDKLYSDVHFPNDKLTLEFRLKIGGRIQVFFNDDLALDRIVKLTPKPVIQLENTLLDSESSDLNDEDLLSGDEDTLDGGTGKLNSSSINSFF
jgi:eukaryotic-like serine/threonine-protein kinase